MELRLAEVSHPWVSRPGSSALEARRTESLVGYLSPCVTILPGASRRRNKMLKWQTRLTPPPAPHHPQAHEIRARRGAERVSASVTGGKALGSVEVSRAESIVGLADGGAGGM